MSVWGGSFTAAETGGEGGRIYRSKYSIGALPHCMVSEDFSECLNSQIVAWGKMC